MKALSFTSGNAYLIACGAKDIENRNWNTDYRGTVFLHNSNKNFRPKFDERMPYWQELVKNNYDATKVKVAPSEAEIILSVYLNDLPEELFNWWGSSIVGVADLVDVSDVKPNSVWADDDSKYYWHFKNAKLFKRPILGIKGRLKFWEYERRI